MVALASRLKDAPSAHAVYIALREADLEASRERAMRDAMYDGAPPFDQQELVDLGQGERCNLNFGEAGALLEQAQTGYYDLTSSVPTFVTVQTTYGDESIQPEWENIIAEEFTKLLKNWTEFEFQFQSLALEFIKHGLGVAYFPDEYDWRFDSAGLATFRFPRNTRATEDKLTISSCDSDWNISEFWEFVQNRGAAHAVGWNVDQAYAIIEAAVNGELQRDDVNYQSWEAIERQLKENDIYLGYAKAEMIRVAHLWQQEKNGKITHCMILRDGCEFGDEFLFHCNDRYDNIHQALVVFTYGIGSKTYHTVRGQGYKIFNHIQFSNQLRGSIYDGAISASQTLVQPTDSTSKALDDLSTTTVGPYAILPPGLKTVERNIPNFAQTTAPVLADLAQQLQNVASSYVTRAVTPEGQDRSAFEVKAQLTKEAVLSTAAYNLFYHAWNRLLREIFRRVMRRDWRAGDPGGKAIFEMRENLVRRGVPIEALWKVNIKEVVAVRAVGQGSPAMRMLAFDEMMSMSQNFDEVGRYNVMRDRAAERVGWGQVDRYLPPLKKNGRLPMDASIAELENQAFRQGGQLDVFPDQNHFVHASIHTSDLTSVSQAVEQGQLELPKALEIFSVALPHLEQHLGQLTADKGRAPLIKQFRQQFQQLSATAQRIADELQAQMENSQKAQQAEQQRQAEALKAHIADLEQRVQQAGDSGNGQLSVELARQLAESRVKMQIAVQESRNKMQILAAEAAQKRAFKDADSAVDILDAPVRGRPPKPTKAALDNPPVELQK
jgi:hypothetical protein